MDSFSVNRKNTVNIVGIILLLEKYEIGSSVSLLATISVLASDGDISTDS